MKFLKIFDGGYTQVYYIQEPSKLIKKLYPKKFIIASTVDQKNNYVENVDTLSPVIFYGNCFIFSYSKIDFNKIFRNTKITNKEEEHMNIFPTGNLSNYFTQDDNIILKLSTKNNITYPCCFYKDLLILTNENNILQMKHNDIKNVLYKTLNNSLNNKITMENWVLKILKYIPLNSDGSIRKFPNEITNKNINNKNINMKNIFINYDIRASDRINEMKIIELFDKSFVNDNTIVKFRNTYNNILIEAINQCNEKKIKYKQYKNKYITLKYGDLLKLKIDYKINDFV